MELYRSDASKNTNSGDDVPEGSAQRPQNPEVEENALPNYADIGDNCCHRDHVIAHSCCYV